jgi:putative endonuclease
LVYYEATTSIESAITREKQMKKLRRKQKIELVNGFNERWWDLYPDIV